MQNASRNSAEKAKIGFLGESPILVAILWPKKWRHQLKSKLRSLSTIIMKKNV